MKSTTKQFLLLLFRGEVHAESENPFQRAGVCDLVFAGVFTLSQRQSEKAIDSVNWNFELSLQTDRQV